MCGRYVCKSDKQRIAETFQASGDLSSLSMPDADYNIAPSTMPPVIVDDSDSGERPLRVMRWGSSQAGPGMGWLQGAHDWNGDGVTPGTWLGGAIGMSRKRIPVAAKMALPTAGARPTIPVSPAPAEGRSLRSMSTTSI